MAPKPVQKPHPPIWIGGGHPDAITPRRDRSPTAGWARAARASPNSRRSGPDPARGAREGAARPGHVSDLEARVHVRARAADVARAELNRWFTEVYHNPTGADASGVHGTPEQVRERLEELVGAWARTTCCSTRSAGTPSKWRRWPRSLDSLRGPGKRSGATPLRAAAPPGPARGSRAGPAGEPAGRPRPEIPDR